MKITTTWDDLNKIPWNSVFECAKEYRKKYPNDFDPSDYNNYMQATWGIDHGVDHIAIIDEQKYMMFLLRWA